MELAYLVGDPKEVHLESLKWKEVWAKVACKDPKKISGTSAVLTSRVTRFLGLFLKRTPLNPLRT